MVWGFESPSSHHRIFTIWTIHMATAVETLGKLERRITITCNVPGMDVEKLRRLLLARKGAVFDGSALDKTTEALALEMAKLGYPFAHAVPRITRDAIALRTDVAFVIDEGQRTARVHAYRRSRCYAARPFDVQRFLSVDRR